MKACSVILSALLLIPWFPAIAESCDAEVVLEQANQDDDGWVVSEFTVLVANCKRSQGTFDYTIYWTDEDGEAGKPIQRVGNWTVQDTDQRIQVTERDQLVDNQELQVVEAGDTLTCVCHD
jgi:hypothetical protein